jgi:hypothetical protein
MHPREELPQTALIFVEHQQADLSKIAAPKRVNGITQNTLEPVIGTMGTKDRPNDFPTTRVEEVAV